MLRALFLPYHRQPGSFSTVRWTVILSVAPVEMTLCLVLLNTTH